MSFRAPDITLDRPATSSRHGIHKLTHPAGGTIALIAQDDSYSATLSISFRNGKSILPPILPSPRLDPSLQHQPTHPPPSNDHHQHADPRSQSDFTFLTTPTPFKELDPGHSCFPLADPPSTTAPGTNATIQLRYTADFDTPANQTFYACADITYVRPDAFVARVPCFNATDDRDVPSPTATGVIPSDLPGHGDEAPPLVAPSAAVSGGGNGGGGGLSKGAIAGAAVGSVVGVLLIVGLALLLYRERQKKRRLERQRDSARGVKWHEEPAKDSASGGSIRMARLSGSWSAGRSRGGE